MLRLNPDHSFNYELLRILGTAHDHGADVAEVLDVAGEIVAGDFESWFDAFSKRARHVDAQAQGFANAGRDASARGTFFRAASYYRAADFFLHGQPDDPRIASIWKDATRCFDAANARLPIPGERIDVQADGFSVPAIFFRCSTDGVARPTLLLMNGYDGSQEEMYHVLGVAALSRDFNVVTFEGPGQPTVIRDQGLTFIDEWEKVVTPLVDWCQSQPEIDAGKLGLVGYSLGGWLVARSGCFEHRLAGIACVDGLFDPARAYRASLPDSICAAIDRRDASTANAALSTAMAANTILRWAIEQGMWAYGCATPMDLMLRFDKLTLDGIVDRITTPVLVCEGADDQFFLGQAERLADALGARGDHVRLTSADSASEHCHVGCSDLLGNVVLDWFESRMTNTPEPA
ncbi:alpha/beta hydrolase family protein [Sphingomonas ginsenosidivorax]|nr:alpha/beta fold hydrolase [Sphingomonas ginsenosidivorax]